MTEIKSSRGDGVVSITASDDAGTIVGSAVFDTAASPHPVSFVLEVAPEARGNGVGRALFAALLDEASAAGIEWLTYTGPADDTLLRLAATSGAVCARRVADGTAKSVVLVPQHSAA